MPYRAPTHKPTNNMPRQRSEKRADPFYSTAQWRRVRGLVLRRDGYTCQACGKVCVNKRDAHVDHRIERLAKPELSYVMGNLQTLCASCHSRKTRRGDSQGRDKGGAGMKAGEAAAKTVTLP